MASNLSGRTIKKAKFLKTKCAIIFDDLTKIEISNETYSSFYLYEGKYLSEKEIKEILRTDEINKYIACAIRLSSQNLLTESKLKSILYQRKCSKEIADEVVKFLRTNDIINDEGFIIDYLEYSNEMLYGERKIKDNLLKKGIPQERVNKLKLSRSNELKKAKQIVKKLEVTYKNNAYSTRKNKIYNALLRKGFVSSVALEAIKKVKSDPNDKLLEDEIKASMASWLGQNEHKYDSKELKLKNLYNYLRNKGYPYSKIKEIWRDNYEYND